MIGEEFTLGETLHRVTFEAEVDYGPDENGRPCRFTVQRAQPVSQDPEEGQVDGAGADAPGEGGA